MDFEQSKRNVSSKTSSKLREMLKSIDLANADIAKERGALSARSRIDRFLDEGTFVEIGTYVKNRFDSNDFSGVICGYGALNGRLVFVFSHDYERQTGGYDEFYVKKILSLYDAALKNGAPIVGIFDSSVKDCSNDIVSLISIGKITKAVSDASGIIPQVALVFGECDNELLSLVSMFDFVIDSSKDSYLISKIATFVEENEYAALHRASLLLDRLPQNNAEGTLCIDNRSNINRMIDKSDFAKSIDIIKLINRISDNNDLLEVYSDHAPEMVTGFIFVSGMSVGVCASRNYDGSNILTAESMKKASRFVCFCDSFNIPLLTLVECSEFEKSVDSLKEMSTLAFSYSSSTNAKVTVMIEDMSKLPFIIMGSKSLGSDIVIAIERNEGDEMIAEAAMYGEVDDIIDLSEIRKRICAAFEMLNSKSTLPFAKKKSNYTIRGW